MQRSSSPIGSAFVGCSLYGSWWTFALRGAAALVFGCLAMLLPVATVVMLTLVFGLYILVDGLLALVAGLRGAGREGHWRGLLLSGLLGLAAGILVLTRPPAASLGLSTFLWALFAAWTIAAGILDLASARRLRRHVRGEWLLGLRGALTLLLGLALVALMLWNPMASLVSLGWLVGLGSFLSGLALLLLAYRLRRLEQILEQGFP